MCVTQVTQDVEWCENYSTLPGSTVLLQTEAVPQPAGPSLMLSDLLPECRGAERQCAG